MTDVDSWTYTATLIGGLVVLFVIAYWICAWRDGRICHICFGSVTKKRVKTEQWIGDEYSCKGCGITHVVSLSRKNPEEKNRAEDPA